MEKLIFSWIKRGRVMPLLVFMAVLVSPFLAGVENAEALATFPIRPAKGSIQGLLYDKTNRFRPLSATVVLDDGRSVTTSTSDSYPGCVRYPSGSCIPGSFQFTDVSVGWHSVSAVATPAGYTQPEWNVCPPGHIGVCHDNHAWHAGNTAMVDVVANNFTDTWFRFSPVPVVPSPSPVPVKCWISGPSKVWVGEKFNVRWHHNKDSLSTLESFGWQGPVVRTHDDGPGKRPGTAIGPGGLPACPPESGTCTWGDIMFTSPGVASVTVKATRFGEVATCNYSVIGVAMAPSPTPPLVVMPTPIPTPMPVPTLKNRSRFIDLNVPTMLKVGERRQVSVTMKNCRPNGNCSSLKSWVRGGANPYRLGSQNPQDDITWGLNRVDMPFSVSPGQQVTFTFDITAPHTPGTYNFQWRMVQEHIEWFGEYTPNVPITVMALATPTPTPTPSNVCDTAYRQDHIHVCYFDGVDTTLSARPVLNQFHYAFPPSPVGSYTAVDESWGEGVVNGTGRHDNVAGIWFGRVNFKSGHYVFHTLSDDGVAVEVQGQGNIISNLTDHALVQNDSSRIYLSGYHDVTIRWYERAGNARIKAWWDFEPQASPTPTPTFSPTPTPSPVSHCTTSYKQNIFHVCYFKGTHAPMGLEPVLAEGDYPAVPSPVGSYTAFDHDWGFGPVNATGRSDNVSAVWRGRIHFQNGFYTFHTISDDGVMVNVEGYGDVISNWTNHPATHNKSRAVKLSGYRNVTVKWFEGHSKARIKFWWVDPPGDLTGARRLVRASDSSRVYELVNGKRHWIPTIEVFRALGYRTEDVQVISPEELARYERVKLLRTEANPRIFYLTEQGFIRPMLSDAVFNSYGNRTEDVMAVSDYELASYLPVQLVRVENEERVYLIEGTTVRPIPSLEVFRKYGYNFADVAPINQVEFQSYILGAELR